MARSRRPQPAWRLVAALALTFAVVLLTLHYRSYVDAQGRAAIVLFSVLETPALSDATRLVTPEPEVQDTTVGGSPAYAYEPGGVFGGAEGPFPTIVFVNGTTPEGRELPSVRRLAEGLARSGYLVFVPDLAGLREDEISTETLSAVKSAVRVASERPDVRDGKVSLVGVSTGSTLSLLAAEDPETKDRVASVSGIAPFADVRTALSIATTGQYLKDDKAVPHESDPFLSFVIARSLLAALPPGKDRDALEAELSRVDRLDPDPLTDLRTRPTDDLGHEAESVVRLLANRNPLRVVALYRALPDSVRSDLDRLSPLAGEGTIEVPVELATAPQDKYFPPSESFAVRRIARDHRVTVTEALEHAEPGFETQEIPAFVSLNAFVVRSLRDASANNGSNHHGSFRQSWVS